MTWSISASGRKAEIIKLVTDNHGPDENASDRKQYDRAKDHVLAELDAADDDASCSVSCSGHTDDNGSYESMSINCGKRDHE